MKKAIAIAVALTALSPVISDAAAPVVAAPPSQPAFPTTVTTTPATPATAPTAATTSAPSGTVAAPSVDTGSDQLSDLQARIPVLKAQAEIAELQARIRTASAAGSTTAPAGTHAPSPFPSGQPVGYAPRSPNPPTSSAIDLVSIRGYKGQYTASLSINGEVVQVLQGDTVDGGWTVSSIAGSEVRLTRKGATRVVRM